MDIRGGEPWYRRKVFEAEPQRVGEGAREKRKWGRRGGGAGEPGREPELESRGFPRE